MVVKGGRGGRERGSEGREEGWEMRGKLRDVRGGEGRGEVHIKEKRWQNHTLHTAHVQTE